MLLANAIRDLPVELDEAARIDGAPTWGILVYVVLPLLRPMIAASLVLSFIYAWNEFLFGLMLTTSRAVPVTVGASFFFSASGGGVQWGVAAAVMIVSALPPLVLGMVAYRHIGRSMTAGAVKGIGRVVGGPRECARYQTLSEGKPAAGRGPCRANGHVCRDDRGSQRRGGATRLQGAAGVTRLLPRHRPVWISTKLSLCHFEQSGAEISSRRILSSSMQNQSLCGKSDV